MTLRFASPSLVLLAACVLAVPGTGFAQCPTDCDADERVKVNELVRAVRIALDQDPVSTCPAADTNLDGNVAVNELVQGVNAALTGCPPPAALDGAIGFNLDSEDPLLLEAPLDNGQTIELFGAVDAAGAPSRITTAVVRGPNETVTAILDESGAITQVRVENASGLATARYDLSWLTPSLLQLDYSDMGVFGTELPLRATTLVDLGIAGGASLPEVPSVASPLSLSGVSSFLPPEIIGLTIRDCDNLPIADIAHVRLRATWRDAGGQITDTGLFVGQEFLPGDFRVGVPVRSLEPPPGAEESRAYCRGFASVVGTTCVAAGPLYLYSPEVCIALQAAVAAATASAGLVAAPVSVPACMAALRATNIFCTAIGGPQGPSDNALHGACDAIFVGVQGIAYLKERQFGETVELIPEVVFDSGLFWPGPSQVLPSVDPATDFDFLVGAPQVLDLRTEPAVPSLGEAYQLIAELSCIPPGSRVFLSARDPSTGVPPTRLIQSFDGSGALCLGVPSDGPGAPVGGYHESILRVTGPGLPGGQELSAQRAVLFRE